MSASDSTFLGKVRVCSNQGTQFLLSTGRLEELLAGAIGCRFWLTVRGHCGRRGEQYCVEHSVSPPWRIQGDTFPYKYQWWWWQLGQLLRLQLQQLQQRRRQTCWSTAESGRFWSAGLLYPQQTHRDVQTPYHWKCECLFCACLKAPHNCTRSAGCYHATHSQTTRSESRQHGDEGRFLLRVKMRRAQLQQL